MKKDPRKKEEEALKDIYRRLRSGDPPTAANARALIKRLFFDANAMTSAGSAGTRSTRNWGSRAATPASMTKADLGGRDQVPAPSQEGRGSLDDIDHLAAASPHSGRIAGQQCRVGLARTERLVKERNDPVRPRAWNRCRPKLSIPSSLRCDPGFSSAAANCRSSCDQIPIRSPN